MLTIPANNLTPVDIFEKLYNGYGSFLLESPNASGKLEKFSFIGINPKKVLHNLEELTHAHLNYGAFGFFSYDFGWEIEELPNKAEDDLKIPHLWFVIPETLIIFDHRKNKIIIKSPKKEEIKNQLLDRQKNPLFKKWEKGHLPKRALHDRLIPYMHKSDFLEMVTKTKEYIAAGDIYQANLSQRFSTPLAEHPFTIYKRLRKINPSPFAAYLDCGSMHLVSCSPERLVRLEKDTVEARPIAGTKPANSPPKLLLLDPKERAEHIMLVDLERNDLGRVSDFGSVKVNEKMVVEKYSHVIHIVSNVIGKLSSDKDKFDLIKAMFPGGTITGCPKIRSMEIIEELEPVKRGPYTGSIGYIMHNKIDLNIAIRTMVIKNNTIYIQVGAGIVADSDPEKEYEETLQKAQALFEALGKKQCLSTSMAK